MSPYHPLHHYPVRPEVEGVVPEEEEEGTDQAMATWLVNQMSHCFPHSPMEMTHMPVQAHQIAATTPEEGGVWEDYHRYHREVQQ